MCLDPDILLEDVNIEIPCSFIDDLQKLLDEGIDWEIALASLHFFGKCVIEEYVGYNRHSKTN